MTPEEVWEYERIRNKNDTIWTMLVLIAFFGGMVMGWLGRGVAGL